jgi:DUF4097 and DUF4098 domain-containing protein YvlB
VRAHTNGGDIELDAVHGPVDAQTNAGDVAVRLVGDPAARDRDADLESNDGDITLVVPDGFSMRVDVELAYTEGSRGDYRIESDFPLTRRDTDEWDDSRGTPRKYHYASGSVNGGRNVVRIRTINGDVKIKRDK